jgi:hypothetical protein
MRQRESETEKSRSRQALRSLSNGSLVISARFTGFDEKERKREEA